jgi:hypothetical protein
MSARDETTINLLRAHTCLHQAIAHLWDAITDSTSPDDRDAIARMIGALCSKPEELRARAGFGTAA